MSESRTVKDRALQMSRESYSYWNSLSKTEQAKAFFVVCSIISEGKRLKHLPSEILLEDFKFDQSMIIASIDAGFLDIL